MIESILKGMEIFTFGIPAFITAIIDPFIAGPVIWSGIGLKIKVLLNIISISFAFYIISNPLMKFLSDYFWKDEAQRSKEETKKAFWKILGFIMFGTPALAWIWEIIIYFMNLK